MKIHRNVYTCPGLQVVTVMPKKNKTFILTFQIQLAKISDQTDILY